ncbi:MAG TPA: ATP-binding protein [Burkholderiales bacterium]|nr:ATP-binding protein [Burkholderiales bacterium]
MKKPLHILLAEDSPTDADLVRHEVSAAYELTLLRVEDTASMSQALRDERWDIVLSDYYMPGFGALAALKLVREGGYDVPFIIVSGNMGEDLAVEAMRAGAADYVMKRNLSRLVPAIARELRDAEARRAAIRAEQQLLEQSALLQGIVDHFPGVVFQVMSDAPGSYKFSHVSEGSIELLELPPARLESDTDAFFHLLQKPDATILTAHMNRSSDNLTPVNWEGRVRAAESGMIKWVNIRLRPRRDGSGKIIWEGFMANITMSKEHEIELIAARKRQTELSSHLENAKEHERARIARELHDDIGGNLTAIKIDVLWLAERVGAADPRVRGKLAALEDLVDQTAAAITRIGQDLRPGILDLGLVAAIEWQAKDFSNHTGVATIVRSDKEKLEIEPVIATALFSILRETLTNIAKHAKATHVRIELEATDEDVELTVTDNGQGIVAADRLKPTSFGLRGMEERTAQLGGMVSVSAARPHGTCIAVRVPHRAAVEEISHGA